MEYTNVKGLPQVLVDALKSDNYDHNPDPSVISATTLLKPPRIYQLEARHDEELVEDVSENAWRLFGSATHYVLEQADNANALTEERLEYFFEDLGMTITGKTDRFEEYVQDYKVTSVWSLVYGSRNADWEAQLNVYAFLWRKAGFDPKGIQVIYILRDWQQSKARTDKAYPQSPIGVLTLKLWSIEKQKAFIRGRLALHKANMELSDEALLPCTAEERWASETKYAVMKKGRKSAVKLHDTEKGAIQHAGQLKNEKPSDTYYIETREGEDKRCTGYCSANKFCNYWKNKYAQGVEVEQEGLAELNV